MPRRQHPVPSEPVGTCPRCGLLVTGRTDTGEVVTLAVAGPRVFVIVGDQAEGGPRLVQSRGYVEHQCQEQL